MASLLQRSFLVTRKALPRVASCQLSTSQALQVSPAQVFDWPTEKFNKHFIDYLNRPDIDGWEVRKALTDIHSYDMVPEPEVVAAALRAIRRVNDFALAIRFLEGLQMKCGKSKRNTLYAWILSEVKPVMDELGIPHLEELGYDKPEFFQPDPDFWWEKKWYKDYGFDKKQGYEHFA